MAKPFSALPGILARYKSQMADATNAIVRQAALAGGQHLVTETPVKRGVARSNWVATVDLPFESVIPAYHPIYHPGGGPAPRDRKFETENASAAMAQHRAAVLDFDCRKNRSIIIRNNVGYASMLKDGHSLQSPPGWFEQVVEVARKAIIGRWRFRSV